MTSESQTRAKCSQPGSKAPGQAHTRKQYLKQRKHSTSARVQICTCIQRIASPACESPAAGVRKAEYSAESHRLFGLAGLGARLPSPGGPRGVTPQNPRYRFGPSDTVLTVCWGSQVIRGVWRCRLITHVRHYCSRLYHPGMMAAFRLAHIHQRVLSSRCWIHPSYWRLHLYKALTST